MKNIPRSMVSTTAGLVAGLIAFSAGSEASARVIPHKSYATFTIHGRTAAELDAQLASRGPKVAGMARHPGATKISFSGTLTYRDNGKGCSVSRADVVLNLKIILPRWANRNHADADLGLLWDTLSADILRHEERHGEIALQHAREMEHALETLPPEKTCKAMQAKASAVTDSEIARHDADQLRFDRVEAFNFEARMMRLLNYNAERRKAK